MNPNQRLYVTPEERAKRMAEQNRHPHGGEGKCGGREGHGTPELRRMEAERGDAPRGGVHDGAAELREVKQPESTVRPGGRDSLRASFPGGNELSREQLVSAMRLSFALGEPACRRYGMPSLYGRKGLE